MLSAGRTVLGGLRRRVLHRRDAVELPYQTVYVDGAVYPGGLDSKRMFCSFDIARELEGRSFVDLGCNVGALVFLAEAAGASRAIGVDIDETVIEVARTIARKHGSRSTFLAADIFDYVSEMPDADYVVCTATFRHLYAALMAKAVPGFQKPRRYLTYEPMDVLIRQNVAHPEGVVDAYNGTVSGMVRKASRAFICSYADRSGLLVRRPNEIRDYFQRLDPRIVDVEVYQYDPRHPRFVIVIARIQ